MKYKQTVRFEKEFVIEAKNAAQANDKLLDAVNDVEFQADVRNQGYHDFEDEPIECPKCKGLCELEDGKDCDFCEMGSVPFGTVYEPKP